MPLMHSKSDKALHHNISREIAAGKPHKQAVAIALEVRRRAKKKQYMSDGGWVDNLDEEPMDVVTPDMVAKHNEDFLSGEGNDSMYTEDQPHESDSLHAKIRKIMQMLRMR